MHSGSPSLLQSTQYNPTWVTGGAETSLFITAFQQQLSTEGSGYFYCRGITGKTKEQSTAVTHSKLRSK